jgi:hypothetical protein
VVWNAAQVASVEGAELVKTNVEKARINIRIPGDASQPYPHETITIHFSGKAP